MTRFSQHPLVARFVANWERRGVTVYAGKSFAVAMLRRGKRVEIRVDANKEGDQCRCKAQVSVGGDGYIYISKTLSDHSERFISITQKRANELISRVLELGLQVLPGFALTQDELPSLIEQLHETLRTFRYGESQGLARTESDTDDQELQASTIEQAEAIARAKAERKRLEDDAAYIQSQIKRPRS